jgi:hypothetical protein
MVFALATAMMLKSFDYLVVDGIVVGVHGDKGWVRPAREEAQITFSEVGVGKSSAVGTNLKVGVPEHGTAVQALEPAPLAVFYSGKAWQPKPVTVSFNRTQVLYAARKFAMQNETLLPVAYLRNVWEVDLDGDGRKEQLVEAISRPQADRGGFSDGDWQAVLLISNRLGAQKTEMLAFTRTEGERCRVRAAADFDGDGRTEVVVTRIRPGLHIAALYSFSKGSRRMLLESIQEDAS